MNSPLTAPPCRCCPACDAVVSVQTGAQATPGAGQRQVCPRCGHTLTGGRAASLDQIVAISLAALIFAVPANLLPILTFSKLGTVSADTLVGNVWRLYIDGYYWVATLVLLCSIVAPVLESTLMLIIGVQARRQQYGRSLILALRWQRQVRRWAMLEVYAVGILVAYIKMLAEGHIVFGVGMVCFMAMLVCALLSVWQFDAEPLWDAIGGKDGD